MSRSEMVARLGLDDREFRSRLRAAGGAGDDFGKKFSRSMSAINRGVRVAGIAAGAAMGAAARAVSEFAKTNDTAAAGVKRIRGELSGLARDIGRDLVGGNGALDRLADGLARVRGWRDDFTTFLSGNYAGDRAMRADEEAQRRGRAAAFEREFTGEMASESAATPAEKRAAARRAALETAKRRHLAIGADESLTGGERVRLREGVESQKETDLARVERATFGEFDERIRGLNDSIDQLRLAYEAGIDDPTERRWTRQAIADQEFERDTIKAAAEARDDESLTDEEVGRRVRRAARSGAMRRDAEYERIRREETEAAEEDRMRSVGAGRLTRDTLTADEIHTLGARGKDAEARRLALGLSFVQQREAIDADGDLTDEQKAALKASNKARFEAQFAAVGSDFAQRSLGAGLGALSGQVFAGPGPQMIDVAKESARILKQIERNTSETAARAG